MAVVPGRDGALFRVLLYLPMDDATLNGRARIFAVAKATILVVIISLGVLILEDIEKRRSVVLRGGIAAR